MARRNYKLLLPPDRYVRTACEQAGCENWRHGWETLLDTRNPDHAAIAAWLRSGASGRTFTELGGGEVVVFRFGPHQRCFEEHRTRPARLLVAQRGWAVEHTRMGDWIEDFGEHWTRLEDMAQKG